MAEEMGKKALASVSEGNPDTDYNILIEQNEKVFKVPKDNVRYIKDNELIELFKRAEQLGLINQQVVLSGGMEISPILDWQYSDDNGVSWENITTPHTCNSEDATSVGYFRGSRKYKTNFSISYTNSVRYLLFHKVGQRCDIYLNTKLLTSHIGGYTPFVIDLSSALKGNNEIMVETFNEVNSDTIPYSAPFNIENGLYDSVYLLTSDTIAFDPFEFGKDRARISMIDIQDTIATFRINAKVIGKADKISIKYYIRDNSNSIIENGIIEDIKLTDIYNYSKTFILNDPHLWNGISDPYLYTVQIVLYNGDYKVDSISIKTGLKYTVLDPVKGFLLNGKEYQLRGFGLVQDDPIHSMAMTKADIDRDIEIIKSTGANFLRLAYYPHNDYMFEKCDECGIIVQTDIPWINHYGVNSSDAYKDSIKLSLTETVNNFYNHTCCVFISLNELLNSTNLDISISNLQGDFDYTLAKDYTMELYRYSKTLTKQHLIGMSATDNTFKKNSVNVKEWALDWIGLTQYRGWDKASIFDHFGESMDEYRVSSPYMAVTEYGAGCNPDVHSNDPIADRVNFSNPPHYEEYQNLLHESYMDQIMDRKWIIFTSAWSLFDFATSGLDGGGNIPFQNSKGLISRDRKIYKDAFYLYKSKWANDPVMYITSRRFEERQSDTITIKAYGNMEIVEMYQNDTLIETLTIPSRCGVVWEFSPTKFKSSADVFKVIGKRNGSYYTDMVTFRTTTSSI